MKHMMRKNLLDVADLTVSFSVSSGRVVGARDISLNIRQGETLGIVGESGSGKSVTAYAIMGLLARNGRIDAGKVQFDGRDILNDRQALRQIRGREVAFIFQNPRAALNPVRTVGDQIADVLAISRNPPKSRAETRKHVVELLDAVRIVRPEERSRAFAHELSGGMCQRVMIAMALAAEPRLLIADEPTTGLDVTTQKVIMDMLRDLAASRGLATILITHDLGLAAEYCERLTVMSKGTIVEQGATADVLYRPAAPYTERLVAATPRIDKKLIELLPQDDRTPFAASGPASKVAITQNETDPIPCLTVRSLEKSFGRGVPWWSRLFSSLSRQSGTPKKEDDGLIHAVRGVSFELQKGDAIGIVGESGSGKTTTSRMIARLLDQSAGDIRYFGEDIGSQSIQAFVSSPLRRRIQVVFQDPLGSLNPRFTAYDSIKNQLQSCARHADPAQLSVHDAHSQIIEAARLAGLAPDLLKRFPHQLSGGQQARVGIARALVVRPELLILDEPTSALDVSVQALVLNQLAELRRHLNLTIVFVSHDLNVVRLVCDRVIVMRHGEVVESGNTSDIFDHPKHAYTRELLEANPHLPASVTS